jgi:hypothetical protein
MHHLRFLRRLTDNLRHRPDRSATNPTDAPHTHPFAMRLQDRMHLSFTDLTTIVNRIKRGCKRIVTDWAFKALHTFGGFAVLMNPLMFTKWTFHLGFSWTQLLLLLSHPTLLGTTTPYLLDVLIGMVFIYLILSLVTSDLQITITSALRLKEKHLTSSIEVLLGGGKNSTEEERAKLFVDRFYDHPLLRNPNQKAQKGFFALGLRRLFRLLWPNRKAEAIGRPYYIAPETFATTLTEVLKVGQLTTKLTEIRLQKFIARMIGTYHLDETGEIIIPADKSFKYDEEKGNIASLNELRTKPG